MGPANHLSVGLSTIWLYSKQGKITSKKLSERVTVFNVEETEKTLFEWVCMKTSKNILINILKDIYSNDFVTASQIGYSNANQYLIKLEKQEPIIRNWSVSRYKIARIKSKR